MFQGLGIGDSGFLLSGGFNSGLGHLGIGNSGFLTYGLGESGLTNFGTLTSGIVDVGAGMSGFFNLGVLDSGFLDLGYIPRLLGGAPWPTYVVNTFGQLFNQIPQILISQLGTFNPGEISELFTDLNPFPSFNAVLLDFFSPFSTFNLGNLFGGLNLGNLNLGSLGALGNLFGGVGNLFGSGIGGLFGPISGLTSGINLSGFLSGGIGGLPNIDLGNFFSLGGGFNLGNLNLPSFGTVNLNFGSFNLPTGGTLNLNFGNLNLGSVFSGLSTGTLNLNFGTLNLPSGGTLNLNFGSLNVGSLNLPSPGTLNLNFGSINLPTGGTLNLNFGSLNLGSGLNLPNLGNISIPGLPNVTLLDILDYFGRGLNAVLTTDGFLNEVSLIAFAAAVYINSVGLGLAAGLATLPFLSLLKLL